MLVECRSHFAQFSYCSNCLCNPKIPKNFRGLRPPNPPPGALLLDPAWGFTPVPTFELHIAISPAQVRCTSTFFAAMHANLVIANNCVVPILSRATTIS